MRLASIRTISKSFLDNDPLHTAAISTLSRPPDIRVATSNEFDDPPQLTNL